MEDQHTSSLKKLKEQILAELRPLVPLIQDPRDRLYAISTLLRSQWEDSLAQEYFDIAKNLPKPDDKARALQTLLSDIQSHEYELETRAVDKN